MSDVDDPCPHGMKLFCYSCPATSIGSDAKPTGGES